MINKRVVTSLVVLGALAGCSTAVPVTARFPEPPGLNSLERCPNLEKLKDAPVLSDVARTVTVNYGTYYECAVKADAWQQWYQVQKRIFEGVVK
jgi:hypothetical protein